jgi:hypothetical protein
VIDRKYIDAKVVEAHIVPGKLLVTRCHTDTNDRIYLLYALNLALLGLMG